MRIIVPHNQTKAEVMQTIDRSINDLFQQAGSLPVRLVEQQRSWQGSTLTFALIAKMGFMSTPIKGTVDVGDHDITIDVDLGMLQKFIPEDKARNMIDTQVRGLLK
ncbi:MAG: hypothetical protein NVS9B4_27850 [Candidatus Acidiferrum sp.]